MDSLLSVRFVGLKHQAKYQVEIEYLHLLAMLDLDKSRAREMLAWMTFWCVSVVPP
jgi:hypothetical protein